MKEYNCIKKVRAFKITAISTERHMGADWKLRGEDGANATVSAEWVNRHGPKVGGYYVIYKDGYASYSPAEAFEEGYVLS